MPCGLQVHVTNMRRHCPCWEQSLQCHGGVLAACLPDMEGPLPGNASLAMMQCTLQTAQPPPAGQQHTL